MGDIKQEHDEPGITIYEIYDEEDSMDEVHACRVCLLTDCKLYPLVDLNDENSYTQVTGLPLDEDDGLPRSLCAECYTLLNKYMQFREKSRIGYQCLMKIFEKHSEVTVDVIKKVNRKKCKLNSNLTIIQNKPNFDYKIVEESEDVFVENKMKQELTVEYKTFKDNDHLYAMNDDTKDSAECDIAETTHTEIDVPSQIVKKRKTKHIKGEFENVVTDNVCIDIADNLKVDPVILVVENHDFKAENKLKIRKKQLNLKTKDNKKRKQKIKTRYLDFDRLIKDNFTTKALGFEEQKDAILKRKSTDNYLKSVFKCNYCFKGFVRELAYKSHMLKHSEKSGQFVCDICQKHCTSKYRLQKHMGDHTHLYSCVSCSYNTQSRGAAKLHAEWHKGKKYKCDVCGVVFLRVSTLFNHLRIKHPTDHVCHICGYSFLGEHGLNAHCKMKHREDSREVSSDSPRCTECNIRFISESALETHLNVSLRHATSENLKRNECSATEKAVGRRDPRRINILNMLDPFDTEKKTVDRRRINSPKRKDSFGSEKAVERRTVKVDVPRKRRKANVDRTTVSCKECDLQFLSWHSLRVHLGLKHRTTYPSPNVTSGTLCDVCGRVFRCAALLRDHLLVHSESAAHSCSVCGKRYKLRSSLLLHSKSHTETTPKYTCAVCGKSYNKSTTLQVHSRLHVESYPCPHCEKTFNQRSNWARHVSNVHSDVRDVKCDLCDKFFKSKAEMKSHIAHVHLKKPWPKRNRQRDAKDGQAIARSEVGKGQPMIFVHNAK